MNNKKFLNITKTKIRLVYWACVLLLMVFIVCPMFFFFYLFDEEQVKQMLYDQFDNNNYHVEVHGKITPRFWHGLSFEVNDLHISTSKDVELAKIKTVSCQLSWLDLVIAHYKVRRMSLNDVEINEKNIIMYGANNLLNLSNVDKSSFSKLKNLSIFGINSIDESAPYPITDGILKIDQAGDVSIFKFGFKLTDKNTFLRAEGHVKASDGDLIKFNDFKARIYNNNMKINLIADTSYHLNQKQLTMDNVVGDMTFNNYFGKINLDKTVFSISGANANNIKLSLNFNNAFANQNMNLDLNKVTFANYKTFAISQANVKYIMGIQLNKVMLSSMLNNVAISESNVTSKTCANTLNYSSPTLSNNGFTALLSGVCEYNIPASRLNLNMAGSFNQAPLKLALKVINSGEKPKIIVSGAMERLDLSPFAVNKDKLKPFYYDTSSLPFSWLSLFDMDGDLSIKSFMLDRIHLKDVSTSFTLNDDVLNVSKLKANVYDGVLVGSAKIAKNESGYTISTVENIHDLDLKATFEDLFDVEAISGKADLQINAVTNNANSYDDLHKHLNGQIAVDASHGAFQGVDFNIFAAPKLGIETNKSTIFDKLSARFNFKNGVSTGGNVAFHSPYISATGNGTVDFVNTTLDYLLTIKSTLPPNEQKISSVIIPVTAKGDLFNPRITIQNIHLFTGQPDILRDQTPPPKKIVKKPVKKVNKKLIKESSSIMSRIKNKLRGKRVNNTVPIPAIVPNLPPEPEQKSSTSSPKSYMIHHNSGLIGRAVSPAPTASISRGDALSNSDPEVSSPSNSNENTGSGIE